MSCAVDECQGRPERPLFILTDIIDKGGTMDVGLFSARGVGFSPASRNPRVALTSPTYCHSGLGLRLELRFAWGKPCETHTHRATNGMDGKCREHRERELSIKAKQQAVLSELSGPRSAAHRPRIRHGAALRTQAGKGLRSRWGSRASRHTEKIILAPRETKPTHQSQRSATGGGRRPSEFASPAPQKPHKPSVRAHQSEGNQSMDFEACRMWLH